MENGEIEASGRSFEARGWADDGLGPTSEALPCQNLRLVDSGVVAPSSLLSLQGNTVGESFRL